MDPSLILSSCDGNESKNYLSMSKSKVADRQSAFSQYWIGF